jgi:DNA helicase-2/ATP-dependent DNA helicase PcrA
VWFDAPRPRRGGRTFLDPVRPPFGLLKSGVPTVATQDEPTTDTASREADPLVDDLTPEQQEAVTTTEGPLLILAGAGSGKTRVLTRRVAYLCAQGVEANKILAITFTNKAAGEMKARVVNATGRRIRDFGRLDHDGPTICTFHSLCLRTLRHYGDILNVPRNFTIFDTGDQQRLMKQALKELDVSSTNFPPNKVLAAVSNAKNALATAPEFASAASDFYQRTVARAYLRYEQLLRDNDGVDFDDLILRTVLGLRDRQDVLAEMQERFQYLHIDEYQDTNRAQYILAHVLAASHKNLCVVGDPDQSIYAWRGADLRNILDFENDYPDATVVRLERNYRSTATILAAADSLIKNNVERKEKRLIADKGDGEKITLLACQDEQDEAREVAERLVEANKAGTSWSDMAIFYRMNSLSRVVEAALRREKIPYQIARGVEFYNRREIKDTLAYLRCIANPKDEVSLLRVLNTPTRGIGDASVKSVQAFAVSHGLGLWDALARVDEVDGVSTRGRGSIGKFVSMIEGFRRIADALAAASERALAPADEVAAGETHLMFAEQADVHSLPGLVTKVVADSGLEKHHRVPGEEEQPQLENIGELVSAAAEYEAERREEDLAASLTDFLHQVALVSDTDRFEGNGGAVTLMTLHAAKGLEFPVVAMLGLEEGCLPHSRARDSLAELEEERRLAFVGITRAQAKLYLSRAQHRTARGIRERTVPSPFLQEIPEELVETVDRTGVSDLGYSREQQAATMLTRGDKLAGRFVIGQRVRHPAFGAGKVIDLTGGTNAKATVHFDKVGRKTLVLEYVVGKLVPA